MESLKGRLKSNYIPTWEESRRLERELSLSVQNIAQIQNEVDGLQNRLEELNQRKDALDAKVIGYRGMFSPARRLVPDILQEIFLHCLPTTTNPVMSGLEAPLVLGRVCSQWRYIAYTTHALWSSIHVAVPLDSPFTRTCSNAVRAKAIVQWLSRAGVLPLSISLSAPYYRGWSLESLAKDSTVEFFLDTIGPFLVRCRSIHISVSNLLWDPFLLKYFEGKFPFLNHLDLDAGPVNWANEVVCNRLKQTALDNAPKLRMVSLINYGSRAVQLSLPWRQLTILKLCDETYLSQSWDHSRAFMASDALLLLSWCPCLVFCNLSLSEVGISYSAGLPTYTMVTLPDLIGLSVQCDVDPKPFFACLNTPSLRYIHYRQEVPWPGAQMNGEDRALHVALGPFIQRVIQPIEELQIVASHLTESDIIQCLELFPELKRLSLTSFGNAFDTPSPTPWGDFNNTSVSGRILDRFMPGTNLPYKPRDVAETSQSQDEWHSSDDEGFYLSPAKAPCLCPKLEVLRIRGASFPDRMLLNFIRFRVLSYARYGVSRIHWLEIVFPLGREGSAGIMEEIKNLQSRSGTCINVDYTTSPRYPGSYKYSPFHGLGSVNFEGAPTYNYAPFFGPMLTFE